MLMDTPLNNSCINQMESSILKNYINASNHSEKLMHTTVILDWDDTLLPSSWIAQNGYNLMNPFIVDQKTSQDLANLEISIINLLETVLNDSNISCFIITNAEYGWVEMSCEKFIPSVCPILKKIKVISARTLYEKYYPNSPVSWKYAAFTKELNNLYNNLNNNNKLIERNILSFGDSCHERDAIRYLQTSMLNANTKSIKFIERPSIRQLTSQITLILDYFPHIHLHEEKLDLILSIQLLKDSEKINSVHSPIQYNKLNHLNENINIKNTTYHNYHNNHPNSKNNLSNPLEEVNSKLNQENIENQTNSVHNNHINIHKNDKLDNKPLMSTNEYDKNVLYNSDITRNGELKLDTNIEININKNTSTDPETDIEINNMNNTNKNKDKSLEKSKIKNIKSNIDMNTSKRKYEILNDVKMIKTKRCLVNNNFDTNINTDIINNNEIKYILSIETFRNDSNTACARS